jgi:hypothetical protein
VSYSDTAISFGTTYCYQVAAVTSYGVSAFSNLTCASPSGGFTLAVVKTGTGAGTVSTSPAGINCGTARSYAYSAGTVVTLAGTPRLDQCSARGPAAAVPGLTPVVWPEMDR